MNDEILIDKLSKICNISHFFAKEIFLDLKDRKLINHLSSNIDKYKNSNDIKYNYYRSYFFGGDNNGEQ